MPAFYLIINQNKLYVWSHGEENNKAEFFNGEPYFTYSASQVKEGVDTLEKILIDNNNLVDKEDLKFDVVFSDNSDLNATFERNLDGQIAQTFDLEDVLKKIMQRLSANSDLYIDEFGINYDGHAYKLQKGELKVEDFSLLAFTLTSADILQEL